MLWTSNHANLKPDEPQTLQASNASIEDELGEWNIKKQRTLMSIIYEVQKRSTVTINRQSEQPLEV